MKASYCVAGERTIDVVGAGAAGAGFVVARLKPGDVEIDGIAMNDRRDGVEESERGFTAEAADRFGQRLGGQRTGRDDDAVPVRRGLRDFFAADVDQRLAFQRRADRRGKSIAVDGKRPAGRQFVLIRRAHDQRGRAAASRHGGDRWRFPAHRRSGTNWNKRARQIRPSCAPRSQRTGRISCRDHGHAAARDLPGRLGTGEAAADHMDGSQ